MSKRPSRQRTATRQFEYRQPSELLPGTEGRNIVDGKDIDDDDLSALREQADDTAEVLSGRIPGQGNVPKRDHRADSDSASPSTKRRRLTTKKESRTKNRSILSDSANDSPSGETLLGLGLKTELTKPFTTHEVTPHQGKTQTARIFTNTDPVIEQWYADPYQRHRPDVQSFEQWCRSNLESSLRNQGLSIQRTQRILKWLVLCRTDGFRPLGDPKQRRRRKQSSGSKRCTKQSAPKVNAEDDNVEITDGIDNEVNDTPQYREQQSDDEVDADNASMISSTVAELNAPEASAKLEDKDTTETTHQPSSQVIKKLTPDRYHNLPDEEKIQIIRERLKVFDVIYGKGMPKTDTGYWRERLDYMSPVTNRARSVPKGGFRTQGHLQPQIVELPAPSIALHNNIIQHSAYAKLPKSAVNHGLTFNQTVPHSRKVLTEDPDFGITRYPKNQTETPEGLEAFNSKRQMKSRSRQEMANDSLETAAEKREEEAEAAEIIVEAAQKDLTVKRWNWETADAMRGFWVDIDSGKTTFDPNTFSFGPVDETWKRIRERKEILARGGDEAEKLLEKEAEEDRKEYERQKRHEQVQRSKAYRIERMQQQIY